MFGRKRSSRKAVWEMERQVLAGRCPVEWLESAGRCIWTESAGPLRVPYWASRFL
jgi:hypothetical protein